MHTPEKEQAWSGRALAFNKAFNKVTHFRTRRCCPFHDTAARVVARMPCRVPKAVASLKSVKHSLDIIASSEAC